MQRELVLDVDRPIIEGLTRALEAMLEEAKAQSRRSVEVPAEAVHEFRRALRRAEAVVGLTWPMLRKVQRGWLASSLRRARGRTRLARDLDAVMPLITRLQELELFPGASAELEALRGWLESCRAEIASHEIVAWRLRKNVRALAGLGDVYQAALHAWVDADLLIESLRDSYRRARRGWKAAEASRKHKDVHELRRRVRTLRYQLELLASTRRPAPPPPAPPAEGAAVSAPATPPPSVGSPSGLLSADPPWLEGVVSAHATMKALVRELGAATDIMALNAMLDEADDVVGFDRKRLSAILCELVEGRIERVLVDAASAFIAPTREFLAPSGGDSVAEEHASDD